MQNKIEDFIQKTTQMWKIIYGLATPKQGEEDPFKGIDKEEEKKEDKKKESEEEEEEEKKEEKRKKWRELWRR